MESLLNLFLFVLDRLVTGFFENIFQNLGGTREN